MRLNIFDWDYAQSKDDNKKKYFTSVQSWSRKSLLTLLTPLNILDLKDKFLDLADRIT